MSDSGRPAASKTVANATLEELITPKLEPGKACLLVIRGRAVGQMLELLRMPAVIGRSPDVDLTIDDVAVSRRHAQVEQTSDGFAVQDLGSTNGVFVNGLRVERQTLRDGDRLQIGTTTLLKFCFQDELEASFQKSLYDSATRDSLTGLYNRRFFTETLDVDFAYALKNDTALSLLLLDLDHFKAVNDTCGHLTGDAVLRMAALLIQRGLRTEDVPARHGGEEFAVLLRYTDGPKAYSIAERIRQSIDDHRFLIDARELRVTVSIGLATLEGRNFQSWPQLIEKADNYLYKAKQQGRNKTVYVGLESSTDRLTANTLNLRLEDVASATGEPLPASIPKPDPGPEKNPAKRKRSKKR